jgi:hypothetical protein
MSWLGPYCHLFGVLLSGHQPACHRKKALFKLPKSCHSFSFFLVWETLFLCYSNQMWRASQTCCLMVWNNSGIFPGFPYIVRLG